MSARRRRHARCSRSACTPRLHRLRRSWSASCRGPRCRASASRPDDCTMISTRRFGRGPPRWRSTRPGRDRPSPSGNSRSSGIPIDMKYSATRVERALESNEVRRVLRGRDRHVVGVAVDQHRIRHRLAARRRRARATAAPSGRRRGRTAVEQHLVGHDRHHQPARLAARCGCRCRSRRPCARASIFCCTPFSVSASLRLRVLQLLRSR